MSSIVYIVFTAYGSITGGNADFRILKNDEYVTHSQVRANSGGGAFDISLPMFPIKVIPGEQTNIKVEWFRAGISINRIENNPASNPNHGRYLTIFD